MLVQSEAGWFYGAFWIIFSQYLSYQRDENEENHANQEMIGPKNQEFMEFGGFGPSHNKIEILLNQNRSQ